MMGTIANSPGEEAKKTPIGDKEYVLTHLRLARETAQKLVFNGPYKGMLQDKFSDLERIIDQYASSKETRSSYE